MPVPGDAFLRATGLRVMGRADRTVHVRCDPFGRHRGVSPIDPHDDGPELQMSARGGNIGSTMAVIP